MHYAMWIAAAAQGLAQTRVGVRPAFALFVIAERGFDPMAFGLWAHHASHCATLLMLSRCLGTGPVQVAKELQWKGVWRNGSASDSRSKDWEFESLCPHAASVPPVVFCRPMWSPLIARGLR